MAVLSKSDACICPEGPFPTAVNIQMCQSREHRQLCSEWVRIGQIWTFAKLKGLGCLKVTTLSAETGYPRFVLVTCLPDKPSTMRSRAGRLSGKDGSLKMETWVSGTGPINKKPTEEQPTAQLQRTFPLYSADVRAGVWLSRSRLACTPGLIHQHCM